MEGLSRKLASNDRVLENINNRMDNLYSAIKNQHSFNKMIESQIAQLTAVVPSTDKGKILGQLKDLKTANLIDIHNIAYYCIQLSTGRWIDYSLSEKKSNPRRPVIPIAIGPKVIYDKINEDTLLYINMCLPLVDQSLCYPKRVLEDAIIRVGQLYVSVDFMVLKTGGDERTPIILGQPFLRPQKTSSTRIVLRSASQSRI
jgi:hypothetical protein